MEVIAEKGKVPIKMWTDGVPVEHAARNQLRDVASLPFIFKHVAVMPDVHLGRGGTVGSVIPTKGAIVPATVGVDIGCGMTAARTNLTANEMPSNLKGLRLAIEAVVPLGVGQKHAEQSQVAKEQWNSLKDKYKELVKAHPSIGSVNAPAQLGTLGSGNHFIEICLDEHDRVWIVLHSGSRGVGNKIGQHFIAKAQDECAKRFIQLPNKDLAYFSENTEEFDAYVEALGWAQNYAMINRRVMFANIVGAFWDFIYPRHFAIEDQAISCHHNYVEKENHFGQNIWVTRKGAVRARVGDLGIIPGSMGTRSYIVTGKGNADSFNSCSHGAGRAMSRTVAKQTFTVEDHAKATDGIECRKDAGVLDESPGAYKSIDAVMAAQTDLVDVVHELRQIVNIKG